MYYRSPLTVLFVQVYWLVQLTRRTPVVVVGVFWYIHDVEPAGVVAAPQAFGGNGDCSSVVTDGIDRYYLFYSSLTF